VSSTTWTATTAAAMRKTVRSSVAAGIGPPCPRSGARAVLAARDRGVVHRRSARRFAARAEPPAV
jgi:histidine ammonia-lyase